MKIISLIHKVKRNNQPQEYFDKMRSALNEGSNLVGNIDVLLGPDYGLSFLQNKTNKEIKVDFKLRPYILEELAKISSEYPETLMLSGTTPRILRPGIMAHSCPVYLNGKQIIEIFKETTCGDKEIAEENGLVYEGQDSSLNHIEHKGKVLAIEICSDHGRQKIPDDTFLELVMAYDDNAGFSERPNNFIERYAVVCDGRKPATGAFSFNPFEKPTKRFIEPLVETTNWKLYSF